MLAPKITLFSGVVLALFSWSRFVHDTVTSKSNIPRASTCGNVDDVVLSDFYRFPYRKEWGRVIEEDVAKYANSSRLALYKAAWLTAGRDVGATFQITSNRTVYIAPPARPWTFSQLSNDELELYTQRTLMFATMLQLMLSAMDQVPSVTLVVRYDENCFGHYTDDKVLNRLDYAAMQEPSPWDEWLGNRKEFLDDRSDMLPYSDVAAAIYWHRPNDPEPSLDCHGTLMPGPESMYYLRPVKDDREDDGNPHLDVSWDRRSQKIYWRGSLSQDSTPFPSAIVPEEDLRKVGIRARVVDMAHRSPHLFDIKLVGNASEDDMFPGFYDDQENVEDLAKTYKYQLNVDSQGPDNRLFNQFMSGSLVFKLESPFKTFETLDMKPWVHYVPVSWSELEWVKELEVMFRWAVSNDKMARKIADSGRKYALERYTYENAAWFMGHVAKRMARRQGSEPFDIIPGSRPFCCEHLKALSDELSSKSFWMMKCEEWTKGRGLSCHNGVDTNPAEVSHYMHT